MCPLHHLHHHNCHHPDTRPQGQIECKCPTHCGTHQKLAVYWNKSPIIGPQHRDRLAYACAHQFRCPPPSGKQVEPSTIYLDRDDFFVLVLCFPFSASGRESPLTCAANDCPPCASETGLVSLRISAGHLGEEVEVFGQWAVQTSPFLPSPHLLSPLLLSPLFPLLLLPSLPPCDVFVQWHSLHEQPPRHFSAPMPSGRGPIQLGLVSKLACHPPTTPTPVSYE